MQSRPMEAALFHADGQTDMVKLIFTFSRFCESVQKRQIQYILVLFLRFWPTGIIGLLQSGDTLGAATCEWQV